MSASTVSRPTRPPADAGAPLVELRGISKRFVKGLDLAARIGNRLGASVREEIVHAVDDVDLKVAPGEIVGLVGESGCGKSTLGRLAAGLLPPSAGERYWRGAPMSGLPPAKARRQQLKTQMIFQDPYASLNPRLRVVDIVGEAPVVHRIDAYQRLAFVYQVAGVHIDFEDAAGNFAGQLDITNGSYFTGGSYCLPQFWLYLQLDCGNFRFIFAARKYADNDY